MKRLTKRSGETAVPSEILGDFCMKMNFCDDFDFCRNCPVGMMMDRLCEYEDTGLEPQEILELKQISKNRKCQRKCTVDVLKNVDSAEFELQIQIDPLIE